MATASDLAGLGTPGPLAGLLGITPTALTGTGTTSGTAVTIQPSATFVNLTTAGSQTGAIFSTDMPLGVPYFVLVTSSTTGVVYPPSGATFLNGSSVNVAQYKMAMFIRYSATVIGYLILA